MSTPRKRSSPRKSAKAEEAAAEKPAAARKAKASAKAKAPVKGKATAKAKAAAASKAPRSRKKAADANAESAPTISHPDKVLFPDDGITKGELAAYYEAIAPVMLPHIRARPVTMERFNRGIGEEGFMQKNVSKGFPEWLQRVEVPKTGGTVHHPLVMDTRSLLWLANQNCITPHVWVTRVPDLFHPDVCVFDLDPSVDDLGMLRGAALGVRDLLAELDLPSWVKTTGSKGYHIVVPLDGSADTGMVSRFADAVGQRLVERDPDNLTREFHKVDRGRRILVDTGRNGYSATFAAAYAVRARPGAPVSAPCTWAEVESGAALPRTFTLRGLAARVAEVGDVWADLHEHGASLGKALAQLRG